MFVFLKVYICTRIDQKGTIFVIILPYSLPSLKQRKEEKESELREIVIKSQAFLLDHVLVLI